MLIAGDSGMGSAESAPVAYVALTLIRSYKGGCWPDVLIPSGKIFLSIIFALDNNWWGAVGCEST